MSHYTMDYTALKRHAADVKAIDDIREYLSAKQWGVVMELVNDPACTVPHLNLAMGFAGVQGFPFHAFCRKFKLANYREWLGTENPTDEEGFPL